MGVFKNESSFCSTCRNLILVSLPIVCYNGDVAHQKFKRAKRNRHHHWRRAFKKGSDFCDKKLKLAEQRT